MRRSSYALGLLGYAYTQAGRAAEARELLKELEEQDRNGYAMPSAFARIYLGLGEIDKGFDWLDKALQKRDIFIYTYFYAPIFDWLRSAP